MSYCMILFFNYIISLKIISYDTVTLNSSCIIMYDKSLTLGGFESKHERTTVHVNVRRKFPFLKTFSKNTRKVCNSLLHV